MTGATPEPVLRFIEYLGELGPRWGLPADPCRVHGYLYAVARPATEDELRGVSGLGSEELMAALAWLIDYRLVTKSGSGAWRTHSDPWELLLRALEERHRREIDPALELLRSCRRDLEVSNPGSTTAVQIARLLALVEDLSAIDTQARRLSPRMLRQLVSLGGHFGRLINRGH